MAGASSTEVAAVEDSHGNIENIVSNAGRRGLDNVVLPVKKHAFSPSDLLDNTEGTRRPISPLSTVSSKACMQNFQDEHISQRNNFSNGLPTDTAPISKPLTTPTKLATLTDEENRTSKANVIQPSITPSTLSVPILSNLYPCSSGLCSVEKPGRLWRR